MNNLSKLVFITNNESFYQSICERIKNIEAIITKFLSQDNRQWESLEIRYKIKSWLSKINDISQFVNVLIFFNERIKNPYKMETTINLNTTSLKTKSNKKILEDEKSENYSSQNDKGENKNSNVNQIFDQNGYLDPYYVNEKMQFANRLRLWTKEYESYNVEKIYISYLRNVRTFPQLNICINLFEIAINELSKRKEVYKKKEKNEGNEFKQKEENYFNLNNNIDLNSNGDNKRRAQVKKKKLIDYNIECMFCNEFGDFLCCEECPNVAHFSCTKLKTRPETWLCPNCQNRKK